ncbi:MAG: riboflavin synthase [Alphaproteobacteria bacterium]
MFTGLVTHIGKITKIETRGDTLFRVACGMQPPHLVLGASIACSGACMTVTDFHVSPDNDNWFEFEASAESLSRTTLKTWQVGSRLNLEGSLALGDTMGGHLVSGHVDGLLKVTGIDVVGDSHCVRLRLPDAFAPLVAEKGSIALNGVSLTVNQVEGAEFEVNIIPHTWQATTFDELVVGDEMNFEIDMLARYVARMLEFKP